MARALVGPVPMLQWLLQHPFNNLEAITHVGGAVDGPSGAKCEIGQSCCEGGKGKGTVFTANERNAGKANKCGVFIMHGDRDGIVPVHMGRTLAAEAKKHDSLYVEYRELHNFGHNDVFEGAGEDWFMRAMRIEVKDNTL